MAGYYLTGEAHADMMDIAHRTFERWGEEQQRKYIGELYRRFGELADNLSLGRSCDELRHGLRRIGQGSHVVYFRKVGDEVEIVRVLHGPVVDLARRHIRPWKSRSRSSAIFVNGFGSRVASPRRDGSGG